LRREAPRVRVTGAEIQRKCASDSLRFGAGFGAGQDGFDALVHEFVRIDTGYRSRLPENVSWR